MQHIFSFDMFSSFSATQELCPPPTCDMGYSKQDPLEELLELKDGDLGYLGWLDAHDESLKKESDEGRGSCDGWWLMVDGWLSRLIIVIDSKLITPLAGADFQTDSCTVRASWNRGQRLPQWFFWAKLVPHQLMNWVEGVSINSQASPWICACEGL